MCGACENVKKLELSIAEPNAQNAPHEVPSLCENENESIVNELELVRVQNTRERDSLFFL